MATYIALKQIENANALLSASLIGSDFGTALQETLAVTPISGATFLNLTVSPTDSDSYSLIVSGAAAIVNAENLQDGFLNDTDSNVPAQLWINGQLGGNVNQPPADPSQFGEPQSNIIDQGEF